MRAIFTPCLAIMCSSLPVTAGTHPDIASLVDPLFASRKEGQLQLFLT